MGGYIQPYNFDGPDSELSRRTREEAEQQRRLETNSRITDARNRGANTYSDPGLFGALFGQHPTPPVPPAVSATQNAQRQAPARPSKLDSATVPPHMQGALDAMEAERASSRPPIANHAAEIQNEQPQQQDPFDLINRMTNQAMGRSNPVHDFRGAGAAQPPTVSSGRPPIRRLTGPNGIDTFTNVGTQGDVMNQPDSPDVGESGRGTFNQSSLEDVAYLPPSVYEEAEKRAGLARNMHLAADPFAEENARYSRSVDLEREKAQFGTQRDVAKQQHTLQALDDIEGQARQMIQEIQSETVDPNYSTPEQKAAAIEKIQQWLESRQAALGIRQRLDGGI